MPRFIRLALVLAALALLTAVPRTAHGQLQAGDHEAEVNGIRLHYRVVGSGTPLVLLHPFGACIQIWAPFLDQLAGQYQVMLIDMRGHGRSTNPSHRFTHRQSAEDVLRLLDQLKIEQVVAIGLSSGAMTLLHVATQQPQRVRAMVLVSAADSFPESARVIMRHSASPERLPPEVLAGYVACASRGDAQVRALVSQFHAFGSNYNDTAFTPTRLRSISARTLIVHGDRDTLFPVSVARRLHDAIDSSSLWVVAGGDHIPIFGALAPAFSAAALRFLEPTRHD
jgi:pimeloyl-ACP methyl ester carboxylesterase